MLIGRGDQKSCDLYDPAVQWHSIDTCLHIAPGHVSVVGLHYSPSCFLTFFPRHLHPPLNIADSRFITAIRRYRKCHRSCQLNWRRHAEKRKIPWRNDREEWHAIDAALTKEQCRAMAAIFDGATRTREPGRIIPHSTFVRNAWVKEKADRNQITKWCV